MNGVLVVDKPAGPTSHDVVERAREVLGVRRIGHTGTLDPFATGVLPVCVGKATRLARLLSQTGKVYRATVRLGFSTTTDDLYGQPLGPIVPVALDLATVRQACGALTGSIRQIPPAYSAKRLGGKRSYELARRGVEIQREAVGVTVTRLEVLRIDGDRMEIDVSCSAGTYVRALARDLGSALGVGGHLVALRRSAAGGFTLDDAVTWEELPARAAESLRPLSEVLVDVPAVRIGREGREAVRHGRDLSRSVVVEGFPDEPPAVMRVLDQTGMMVALAVPRGFGPAINGFSLEPTLHPDIVLID